jgi:ABC-2 type transport system ATP-binding protein
MALAIECSDLQKVYPGKPPVNAVNGLDLHVSEGECFGLLGPNGAGKTTTIEILEGLLEPTRGEIRILGMDWNKSASAIKNRIGISLQETRLADKLSVLETLTLFRSFYQDGIDAEQAIATVGLEEKARTWVEKLSGGQKQRLAVATALVGNPDLLFLDEPTTGLDPQSRRGLWDVIRSFRARGKTIMLTTHYMDEAERLCDRVGIVDHGQIIALGSPRELIASVGMEHVIEFSVAGSTPAELIAECRRLPSVKEAHDEREHVRLSVEEPHVALPGLMEWVTATNRTLASLTTRHASLEDVFVHLTGRHLSEQQANGRES